LAVVQEGRTNDFAERDHDLTVMGKIADAGADLEKSWMQSPGNRIPVGRMKTTATMPFR